MGTPELQTPEQGPALAHTSYLHGAQNFNIGGDLNIVQGTQNQYKFNTDHERVTKLAEVLCCPSPSPFFVGREDILGQLMKIFIENGNDRQRVVVLVAPGGSGKTQVALKFVSENHLR